MKFSEVKEVKSLVELKTKEELYQMYSEAVREIEMLRMQIEKMKERG